MPQNDDEVTTLRWELGKVKMNLTDEQIEAAARVIYNATKLPSEMPYDALSHRERMPYRTAAVTVAGFVQMPWEMPTQNECELIGRAQDVAEVTVHYAVSSFINMRNAALMPKPADPRREKVKAALIGEVSTFLWNTEEAYRAADRILAALDAKDGDGFGNHDWMETRVGNRRCIKCGLRSDQDPRKCGDGVAHG